MTKGNELGIQGELAAMADLVSRGFLVYRALSGNQHPDLVAVDTRGRARTVEVRVITRVNRGNWKRRKKTDQCHHYAWVSRDLSSIEYEPKINAA